MIDRGERSVRFIENLTHSKGKWANKPLKLEPWQREFILRLFGTMNPEGLRQFKNAFVFLPRKNGKSTLAAAIALFCLLADGEAGAEIYSAANDREQASLVFNEAAAMVRADPTLSSLCQIIDSQKKIRYRRTNSFYKALSAEAGTKHGLNPSVVIYDELHQARTPDLFEALKTGMGARQQPLFITLTTAGNNRHSVAYELYRYAKQVQDGVISDPTFLPLIYEAPPGADWQDEAVWHAANPNLGITKTMAFMREEAEKAKAMPSRLNAFRMYHLNQWVDSDLAWLPFDKWSACGAAPFDWESLKGRPCWAGLDLSSTVDISALVLVFPTDSGGWAILPHFWIPKEGAFRREKIDAVPYVTWSNGKHLTMTPGDVIDYSFIRQYINDLGKLYTIREIAFDRKLATELTGNLEGDGFTVVPYGQGFLSMSAPCREIERAVIGRLLVHPNNPVMDWMVHNAVAEEDAAGNLKVTKGKSTERIDGVVALAMGLGRAMVRETKTQGLYTGLLVI